MFEILLINADYGQLLDENGNLDTGGARSFSPRYELIEDALKMKDFLLEKYIYAAVVIRNLQTDEFSEEYKNEILGPLYFEEKRAFYHWAYLPAYKRFFIKMPEFKYYDGRR